MALGRYHTLRNIYQTLEIRDFSTLLTSSRSYSKSIADDTKCWSNSSCLYKWPDFHQWNNRSTAKTCSLVPHLTLRNISSCVHKDHGGIPRTFGDKPMLHSTTMQEPISYGYMRSVTTQAKAPAQARQMGAVKVSMVSPGIIYDPYAPRERIPFWKRYFTRSGWKRTKEELSSELKSAYAIAKLRKGGYSKQKFYAEAVGIYKEINTQMANGGKTPLRKLVTEHMYSALKNEIKQRESVWPTVYWELIEPIVKVRTLRARLIGVDKNDLNKAFIQLTLEFLSKQKFEAYDGKGAVVSGDRNKEVLVRDIWVFEKSLFHPGAYWRLCGRIKV
ncbi:uncharacterized protein LOC107832747 [Nicotiana tabacum]|uniref:Large ribosomal subunit protein mL45 n=1 Tax=Nicotiana tabacum TaxID=4097 RepID=A0A1S4DSI9_TOBAC|nr:PREDICTED: 39S ribosomal protein L45, mitochondrial-like isoform X1 [Nicotiana tabacum]